jgi:hypothetical protein
VAITRQSPASTSGSSPVTCVTPCLAARADPERRP